MKVGGAFRLNSYCASFPEPSGEEEGPQKGGLVSVTNAEHFYYKSSLILTSLF